LVVMDRKRSLISRRLHQGPERIRVFTPRMTSIGHGEDD
jgi:hypothetical protein